VSRHIPGHPAYHPIFALVIAKGTQCRPTARPAKWPCFCGPKASPRPKGRCTIPRYGRGPSRHIHMTLHDTTLHCPCPTSFNLQLYITKPQPSSKKRPLFLAPFHMPHPWDTPKTYAQSQRKRGSYVVRDHTIGQPIFIICCTLALHIYNY